jgi:hypothetical protein
MGSASDNAMEMMKKERKKKEQRRETKKSPPQVGEKPRRGLGITYVSPARTRINVIVV